MNYPSKNICIGACSYGLVRKLLQVYDAKTVDFKDRETPLLFSQKAAICLFGAPMAIYAWPIYLYMDASKLEIKARKANPEDYGYRPKIHWLEYFFE